MWGKLRSSSPHKGSSVNKLSENKNQSGENLNLITKPLQQAQPLLEPLREYNKEQSTAISKRMGFGKPQSPVDMDESENVTERQTSSDGMNPAQISINAKNVSEKPHRTFMLASRGRVQELEKLFNTDPEKLKTRDAKGRTPLHYAATSGQVAAIGFLLDAGADVDEFDKSGNTALHIAVENDRPEAVKYLLKRGASTDILNHLKRAPVHLAVQFNKPIILEILLSHPGTDASLSDGDGGTPLHYAAWKDHPDCALKLLEHGALMCKPCNIGLYPLHVAAQNASSKTLQTLLQHAEKAGYKREDILKFVNQERFTPLHAAITGGDLMAVRVCIEAGAQIDVQQEDGDNAVHLAASNGATAMIQLMFELQPHKKDICINARDKLNMTPTHKAALYNRAECLAYLLDQGAEIDAVCDGGNTPILLAASKRSWEALAVLYNKNANCRIKDDCDRNLLHLIIMKGGKPGKGSLLVCHKETGGERMKEMLNEQDKFGCTPLHYASEQGQLSTLGALIQQGASINTKNNNKQSPLHFAARYGRINTCRLLLESPVGHSFVNETDEKGMTPIHVASSNGHVKVVQLLLQKGAGLYRDTDGNTPLHLAAKNGYTNTMTVLMSVQTSLIESENKEMDTPLILAAHEGQASTVALLLTMGAKITKNMKGAHFLDGAILNFKRDVCITTVSHERWRECLDMPSSFFGCPMLGFIKHMPDVCQMVLDRCRTSSSCDNKSKDFYYDYDFHFLQKSMDKVRELKSRGEKYMPMCAVNMMIKYKRLDCVSHPVCLQFLHMKWRAYGMAFSLVNLLIYVAFLTSLTVFVVSYQDIRQVIIPPPAGNDTNDTDITTATPVEPDKQSVQLSRGQHFLVIFILAFCVLNAVKEILQMIQLRVKYLVDPVNYLEWVLYISSGIFIGPFVINMTSTLQWECGAISIFLAWCNLMLSLQRFDFFGIYVVMFLEILKTLIQVIIVFSVLIIAFGLSFYILLSDGTEGYGYRNPALSLMTTIVMMLGNIDYIDNWVLPYFSGEAHFMTLRSLMLIMFTLLMPILLINLLIGLAVGDITAVQRDARLKRLAMQVELHTDIEKKIPQKLLEKVDRTEWRVYPNGHRSNFERIWSVITKTITDHGEFADNSGSKSGDGETFVYQELFKQKQRMKQITSSLDKTYDMVKLIVQKMEIHTEADEIDEGETTRQNITMMGGMSGIGWSSPAIRQNLIKQASIVEKWKHLGSDKL